MKTIPRFYEGLQAFTLLMVLVVTCVFFENSLAGIIIKLIYAILAAFWLVHLAIKIREDKRRRAEILAAQERFVEQISKRGATAMFSNDPDVEQSQAKVDLEILRKAFRDSHYRDLLDPTIKLLVSMS